uniref:Microtubule associated scaffold protein 2 n=1 Tax=Junco hyemalis TaxID=40217 RepID=A0A8C5J7E8_JUNHY
MGKCCSTCFPPSLCEDETNENALVKIKELGVELEKIREEVELNTARWKELQSEKEQMERRFQEEGQQLRRQQQQEMQALEQRLQQEYQAKKESLQEQHRLQLEQAKLQHQDQVEDLTAVHEAAMSQLENNHIVAITILQDENDCKIQELNTAHKLEKAQLEETFEKLRLSLQDQIDTLTFQNQSLKAKADRFEEALKKNTEEQLKVDDNSNYTGIKIHVSKYYTSTDSMKSSWILIPGAGGRSHLRSQILNSEEESQILAKGETISGVKWAAGDQVQAVFTPLILLNHGVTWRNLCLMAEDVCMADISKPLIYFLDCASSVSTLRKRSEELKTCSGNEEPPDSPAGEDDYGARKTGELSFFLQRSQS